MKTGKQKVMGDWKWFSLLRWHCWGQVSSHCRNNKHLGSPNHKLMFIYTILFMNMKIVMITMTKNSIVTLPVLDGAFWLASSLLEKKSYVKPSSKGTCSWSSEPCSACRGGSPIKIVCCSCRGPEHGSQHTGWFCHILISLTPKDLTPSSGQLRD